MVTWAAKSFLFCRLLVYGVKHYGLPWQHPYFSNFEGRKIFFKEFYGVLLTFSPAAADTLLNFFKDTDTKPEDYDYVFTGDLGFVGSELFLELLARHGVTLNNHRDCGKLMFDRKKQDVHSGGSGCGCVGSLFCSYILESLKRGDWSKVLVMGTGALLSTVSAGQGESVPSIAHLVEIEKI